METLAVRPSSLIYEPGDMNVCEGASGMSY